MSAEKRELGEVVEGAADAIAGFDAVAGTHLIGFAAPLLLPLWCRESLVRDAARTGRSVASITAWALAWPFATVVVLMLPVLLLAVSDPRGAWAPILVGGGALAWLIVPFAVGGIVASRARRLGGFGAGFVGLALGGLLVGIIGSAFALLAGLSAEMTPTGALGALIWIPLGAFVVPVLTATQFGIGLVGGSILGEIRAR